MQKFQEQSLRDHQDAAVIVERQAYLRENGLAPAMILGIRVEALREWESVIRACAVILGFMFMLCMVNTTVLACYNPWCI